ncbi:hypothetical protein APHAL10511_001323 [Amanita phalloides]|nr:hypothetical protein APHAL10511_001323 [Amanita phalloides]
MRHSIPRIHPALRTRSTSFIGLGRMGYEMAYNIFSKQCKQDKDARFVVCDAISETAQHFRQSFISHFPDAKLEIAHTPEEAALASSTIITMLPSSPQVNSVYRDGIIPSLNKLSTVDVQDTLCIDSTTLDITVAREVAKEVSMTGAYMIDAPVSGGVTGAKAGSLSFLVGGTKDAFEKAHPILSYMGQRLIHCGASGAGLGAKICNNLILGVHQIVIAEAMLLGQKIGLDPGILASVINSSTGACWASSVNNPVPGALAGKSPPCDRGYEGGFATALMLKDMGLATEIANQQETSLPLGEAAEKIYNEVIKDSPEMAQKDFSSVYLLTSASQAMTRKPSALIFGGLNTFSRPLAALLVPLEGEPLVSHLRIVDKFSVQPPTTYIGSEFPKILQKPQVEYRQANLTVPTVVSTVFEPKEGDMPFDYVFDFTGEVIHDRAEPIIINATCNIARLLGLEAAKRKVKAYVRVQQPFYDSTKKSADEPEDVRPAGPLGTWWHETLRILGAIVDLNLVILRAGFCYGPFINYGVVASAITVMSVYGYMKKPFKSLWSPGKNPTYTVHVDDIAGAAWACAEWISLKGRKAADAAAGEEIAFHNDKSKVEEVVGVPPHDQTVVASVFSVVDDSDTTTLSMGETLASYFGTSFGFFNLMETTVFKLKADTVELINEHHVSAWIEMIANSKPPIPNTPLSAYLDNYGLKKHCVAFSNEKVKETVGYRLKRPNFNHETVGDVVEKWKSEGIWPNLE